MSEQEQKHKAIVIEIGSSTVKAGFAGDKTPKVIFPTIIGKTKEESKEEQDEYIVGMIAYSDTYDYSYPIGTAGVIKRWDHI